jgi:hypothetical protein
MRRTAKIHEDSIIISNDMKWKLPPGEKIYEALSVLADNRYEMKADGKAVVTSSAGDKHYTVSWAEAIDHIKINSNDNASRWQGYMGYPIIALLMITRKIQYDPSILPHFKGIEWNRLNKAYKNDYAKVVELLLNQLDDSVVHKIKSEVDHIFEQLSRLTLTR